MKMNKLASLSGWLSTGSQVALAYFAIDAYVNSSKDQWGLIILVSILSIIGFLDQILVVSLKKWEAKPQKENVRIIYVDKRTDAMDSRWSVQPSQDWED